jgi:hypothetical protein
MSYALGTVIHDGRIVGNFSYNATAGLTDPAIVATPAQAIELWHREIPELACSCGGAPADVYLHADHAQGFYWPAKACIACGIILSNTNDDLMAEMPIDGLPPGITAEALDYKHKP